MRQVLVKGSGDGSYVVDRATLHILHDHAKSVYAVGLNIIRRPMPIQTIQGGEISFQWQLARSLVNEGLLLAGAYQDGQEVVAAIFNPNKSSIVVNSRDLIVGLPYEQVLLHETKVDFDGFILVTQEKAVKPKGKKRK